MLCGCVRILTNSSFTTTFSQNHFVKSLPILLIVAQVVRDFLVTIPGHGPEMQVPHGFGGEHPFLQARRPICLH